jgi:hypothetical protein
MINERRRKTDRTGRFSDEQIGEFGNRFFQVVLGLFSFFDLFFC